MSDPLQGIPEERLTREEENLCAVTRDLERLVLHNLREAVYYIKGCVQFRNALNDGEILSACYEALQLAAVRFKPGMIRFFAYAKADVRGAIIRVFRGRDVVRKIKSHESLPVEREDFDEMNASPEIPAPIANRGHALASATEAAMPLICLKSEWTNIQPLLRTLLNDRERMILELHFLGDLNLQQIGQMLAISRSAVQHSKQVALKKIRHWLIDRKRYYKHDLE